MVKTRDTLFLLGLAAFCLFGCALDSQGLGFWLAAGGVIGGITAMILASWK